MKSGSPGERSSNATFQTRRNSPPASSTSGAAASSATSRTAGSRSISPPAGMRDASETFFLEREESAAARTRAAGPQGALSPPVLRRTLRLRGTPAPRRLRAAARASRRRRPHRAASGRASGACAASRRVRETRAVCPLHPFRSRFSSSVARDAGESGRAPSRRRAATATPGRGRSRGRSPTSRALRADLR